MHNLKWYSHVLMYFTLMCVFLRCTGSRRNLVAMTRNKEEWRESSEDMNKGAGEMDEGSGERQQRDRDGWSEECGGTGAPPRRETIHRCTEEIRERLWKNDKSRSWGRRDNEQRQRVWVHVRGREGRRPGGRRGEKKKWEFMGENLERRGREVPK